MLSRDAQPGSCVHEAVAAPTPGSYQEPTGISKLVLHEGQVQPASLTGFCSPVQACNPQRNLVGQALDRSRGLRVCLPCCARHTLEKTPDGRVASIPAGRTPRVYLQRAWTVGPWAHTHPVTQDERRAARRSGVQRGFLGKPGSNRSLPTLCVYCYKSLQFPERLVSY